MNFNKDPYEVLSVSQKATDDDIKKAYRRLSKKYHPDLNRGNKGAEEKFKEINAAYEILSDQQKRAQYDQFGAAAFSQGQGADYSGFGGFDFSGFQSGAGGFADIFESFFGDGSMGRRKSRSYRGKDLEMEITIRFEEAIFGTDKIVSITKDRICESCDGKGIEKGSKIIECSTCHGAGVVTSVKNTLLGAIRTSSTCPQCDGEGQVSQNPCGECRGKGSIRASEQLTIRIPAGISDGTTLRLSGKGGAGSRGQSFGDLYVHVTVSSSSEFERKSNDIYGRTKIHFLQAVLGDTVEVKTVHGTVRLEIPAGTQSGQVFRIRDKGAPKLNSSTMGDHYVKIHVDVPKKLSSEERQHYLELAKLAHVSKNEGKGFFSNLFS